MPPEWQEPIILSKAAPTEWLHGSLASVPAHAVLAVYCQRPRENHPDQGWRVVADIPSPHSPIILASDIDTELEARAILSVIINGGTP